MFVIVHDSQLNPSWLTSKLITGNLPQELTPLRTLGNWISCSPFPNDNKWLKAHDQTQCITLTEQPSIETIEQLEKRLMSLISGTKTPIILLSGLNYLPILLKCNNSDIISLITRLQENTSQLIITSQDNNQYLTTLLHLAECSVNLQPLATGRAKDVDGWCTLDHKNGRWKARFKVNRDKDVFFI
ncbi:hypothetical protein DAMA08_042730 [Martiniozyma asiatica (nom. inval.)]|nr:hypothetical protein DAMA08_027040 [Martiniozyma asiatica]GMM31528.1 hypothetical protein DAMA08_042730 [Martiniozyma asiatica]